VMHFFTKLQFEIKKILLNYQNFLNQWDNLITLITHLKNNICESDATVVKKAEKNIWIKNTFIWTSHFND